MKTLEFPLEIVNKKMVGYLTLLVSLPILVFGYFCIINTNVAVSMVFLCTILSIIVLTKLNKKKLISNNVLIFVNAIIVSTLSSSFSNIDTFIHPTPLLTIFAAIINVVIGILSFIFSLFLLYLMIISLKRKRSDITIDNDGIKINSFETVFARQILWTDIEEVSTSVNCMIDYIDLKLKNPQAYQSTIDNQKNSIRRWFMNYLFKKSGGVVKLSSIGTNISFKDLEYIVRENFEAKRAA